MYLKKRNYGNTKYTNFIFIVGFKKYEFGEKIELLGNESQETSVIIEKVVKKGNKKK